MKEVFIVESVRTPVGKYGGALSSIRPDDMLGMVIRELATRTSIDPSLIEDVIIGCANQAGEDNRNVARMGAILGGLPVSVPGVTVNRLCASSLEAIIQGARAIRSNEAELVIVGGVESMSRAPYSLAKNVSGGALFGNVTAFDTALGWRYPNKELEKLFPLESMGETAENLVEKFEISREDQDQFALESHQKAISAQTKPHLQSQIIPILLSSKSGDSIIDRDEQPRGDSSIEKLASLKPAFRKGGTVTAGNSSSLNDGCACLLLASESAVKLHGLTPIARYVSSGVSGVDPRIMGIGPVGAIRQALGRAQLSLDDMGLVEINEAFAAQVLSCVRELNVDVSKLNVNGGAIAIGHPLGMSGARIVGGLTRELKARSLRYGVASLCIGVGQGLAAVFENV